MNSEHNVALYGQGLFNTDDPKQNATWLKGLVDSGFNTLMLCALHVDANGHLYWGSQPIAKDGKIVYTLNPSLPQIVSQLRAGGFETIQFAIGSADAADWRHIEELLQDEAGSRELEHNFAAVARWLKLDGFDFDCEENVLPKTITTMTAMLAPFGTRRLITYSVYWHPEWWLNCLTSVYAQNGAQLVTHLNLQTYFGQDADPRTWIEAVNDYPQDIGVTDRTAFIVPGYADDEGPSEIRQQLAPLASLGVKGAFVWQAVSIFESRFTPKDFASAIRGGLDRKPSLEADAISA